MGIMFNEPMELKPCPFCGGKPVVECESSVFSSMNVGGFEFHIVCDKCGAWKPNAKGSVRMGLSQDGRVFLSKDDREEAAKVWNMRASDE